MQEKNQREKRRKQKIATIQTTLWTMLVLIQMTLIYKLDVKAQEVTIYSPFYEQESDAVPPESEYRTKEGEQMELLWWETVPVVTPRRSRTLEKEIVYHDVEGITQIPQEIEVEAVDNGQRLSARGRLSEQRDLNEQWQEGFRFTLTFHHYQADFYQAGDLWIPNREEKPNLEGVEIQILELVGLSAQDYQITDAIWAGEPYEDESGVWGRDAWVLGKKLVREVFVRYQTQVEFESKTMWQTVAVYGSIPESKPETEGIREPGSRVVVVEEENAHEEEEPPPSLWQRIIQTLFLTIALGTLLFFGGLLILAALTVAKKLRAWYNNRNT